MQRLLRALQFRDIDHGNSAIPSDLTLSGTPPSNHVTLSAGYGQTPGGMSPWLR